MSYIKPLVVRPADAARIIGFSLSKLHELITAGEIPAFKRGRTTLIRYEALERWVDEQERKGA